MGWMWWILSLSGPAKERILRIFLEKNAEGRARLKAEIAAGAKNFLSGWSKES